MELFQPLGAEQSLRHQTLTWRDVLHEERSKDYFLSVQSFVEGERALGRRIYPPINEVFSALKYTPLEEVRVVILGQDPYHGPGQAHGLCFSVRPGVPLPPSLQNIFKELRADLGVPIPSTGCLIPWAQQGVLLLNAVLTVEEGKPGSHANKGWEQFTDRVVEMVLTNRRNVVFLLWGSYAQKKAEKIAQNGGEHLMLRAPHPSPLSASRGFFGCRHFSQANAYLLSHGEKPIEWGGI